MVTSIGISTDRSGHYDFHVARFRICPQDHSENGGKSDERRKEENLRRDGQMRTTSLGDLVDVVRSVGRERAQILERAKDALTKGDEAGAIELFRELLGVQSPSVGS